jgi:hypothetical protein
MVAGNKAKINECLEKARALAEKVQEQEDRQ